jgi:hypothetical protein
MRNSFNKMVQDGQQILEAEAALAAEGKTVSEGNLGGGDDRENAAGVGVI